MYTLIIHKENPLGAASWYLSLTTVPGRQIFALSQEAGNNEV